MNERNMIGIEQRLRDLISLPTVSLPTAFAEMAERTGWAASQQATFDAVAEYLQRWMASFADEVGTQAVVVQGLNSKNIWGRVRGHDSSRAILLQGHFDVVEVNGNFAPQVQGQRLYGRGTTDMKGALVTALHMLEHMVRAGKRPALDTYVLLTCEEEIDARGARHFAQMPPTWVEKVVLAICMEPAYDEVGTIRMGDRHPGVACVTVERPLVRLEERRGWKIRVEPGKAHVLHSSREPLTLDPNALLLSILGQLPACPIAALRGDRRMDGAANSTSYFAEGVIAVPLDEVALVQVCSSVLRDYLAQIPDAQQRASLHNDTVVQVEPAAPALCFDGAPFVSEFLAFKAQVAQGYANPLFGRPPFTVAVALIEDGIAQAKVDIRTDRALREQLPTLLDRCFPQPSRAAIRWNDPGLDDQQLDENPYFQRLRAICSEHTMTVVEPRTGWTEAAIWSTLLAMPTIVVGPGGIPLSHTANEYIDLEHVGQMATILETFLLAPQ